MRRIITSACLAAAMTLAVGEIGGGQPAAADDESAGLPEDAGREDVVAYCGACHSMRLVVQQGLTRGDWAELLEWMYEEQGMAELEPDEEKLVLDYLAKHVGPDSQKQRLRERGLLP